MIDGLSNCLSYLHSVRQQLEQYNIDQREFLSIRICKGHMVAILTELSFNNVPDMEIKAVIGGARIMGMGIHIDGDCALCHLDL